MKKNLTGFSNFGAMLKGQMEEVRKENIKRPLLELGIIQKDFSLITDSFPVPIPKADYLVCRSLTIDETQPLTETVPDQGKHGHGPSGEHSQYTGTGEHTHPETEGSHIHEIPVPESMQSLKPDDRVLVAWINGGNRAVVIDIVLSGEVL